MSNWFTGSGKTIEFEEIVNIIESHSEQGGHVYVGSDSFLNKKDCTFSTAICLHAADGQSGGRYFIKRNKFDPKLYENLIQRITAEVKNSIDIGLKLIDLCPEIKIELHLDVSSSEKNTKTSKFSDMLVGYANGSGFECKIKPMAFAATSIADKHSK